MQRSGQRCWWMVMVVGALASCASEPDPIEAPGDDVLLGDDLLVPISRAVDAATLARRAAELDRRGVRSHQNEDFYLAVRRSALEGKWFWSTYLKEFQPFGPNPATLGTRVVRFREQNGKLYVFDVDIRRNYSDVFHPDLILDAFPIVKSGKFESLPGSGSFVLIDPAAGLNRYDALGDWFGSDPGPVLMANELSFVQNFRGAPDGGHFEQIVVGYTDIPIGLPFDNEANEFRMVATLGVNLRRYTESAAYQQVDAPPVTHYFLSAPIAVPNTGRFVRYAEHWAFTPGMKPIKWVIGREILDIQANPTLGNPDLLGAMKRGIESWNAVFGYPVFEAELAGPNDSYADDHVNFLIVDPDVSKGFAFADWRDNPNTGEIRGASVYFGGGWFRRFTDDPALVSSVQRAPHAKTPQPGLMWLGKRTEPLCVLWAPDWEDRLHAAEPAALTGKEKLERRIQEVTAHEIGHVLGLRHNFKGSLVPPTSTVMEYNLDSVKFVQPTPGIYDHQAVHFLYGMTPDLPTAPFCNDGDTLHDPECVRFDDPTPTPFTESQIPFYRFLVSLGFDGFLSLDDLDFFLGAFGTELLAFARAGTAADAPVAWQVALEGVRPPLTPAQVADPAYLEVADVIARFAFGELDLAPRGQIQIPISNPAVLAAVAADGQNIILNTDGVRPYPTRRLVVDALKAAQNLSALQALRSARDTLAAQLGGLGPADQALTADLIARIDAAITPYFE